MDFYKHDIPDWMDGTEGLDAEPYRAYHVICQLIYLSEGPIALNEHGIAGRCKQSIRTFRAAMKVLIESGKLTVSDGKISNSRAKKELEKVSENRLNASKGGHKSAEVRSSHHKSLEINEPPQAPLQNNLSLIEERRGEETKKEKQEPAVAAPEVQKAPDARVFSRGREVLGKQAGGLIKKLIDAREKNYALCIADLETASTKHSPVEWIGKIISNRTEDRYANLDPRAFGGKLL